MQCAVLFGAYANGRRCMVGLKPDKGLRISTTNSGALH